MCHAPGDYQSLDVRKIYACVFWPVKSTKRVRFMQNSLKAQMKENIRRSALL